MAAPRGKLSLDIRGDGPPHKAELCGRGVVARSAPPGRRVVARVGGSGSRPRVIVKRCRNGHWVDRTALRPQRRGAAWRSRVDTGSAGDYRIRAREGRRRSRPSFLRVGVGEIVDTRVRFPVENVNRSQIACPSDGAAYEVVGRLVAPRRALLSRDRPVTLYLHGLGFGKFYWRFRDVPGYDLVGALARAGHASIVVDRLGYDASGHPDGNLSCFGSQADVAHQVVAALRTGSYQAARAQPPAFGRVALAGHSAGSLIAQIVAYSFGDIDALVLTAFADQGQSPALAREAASASLVCASGGEPADEGAPRGYAYFGQTPADFRAAMFHDVDRRVVAAATVARNRNPCGDTSSFPQVAAANQAGLAAVEVPVLIICASDDALFPAPGCGGQQDHYTGSADVTSRLVAGAGHALALERTRHRFRRILSGWLRARGL